MERSFSIIPFQSQTKLRLVPQLKMYQQQNPHEQPRQQQKHQQQQKPQLQLQQQSQQQPQQQLKLWFKLTTLRIQSKGG